MLPVAEMLRSPAVAGSIVLPQQANPNTERNMTPGGESSRDQVNVRLSDDAVAILYALQDHYGVSQAAVFEMLLRDRARTEGITPNMLAHAPRGTSKQTVKRRAAAASTHRPRGTTTDTDGRREKR
jgi:hypothetical protein